MFSKLIRYELINQNMKISDLAKKVNNSNANLSQKLKRDNFSELEMQAIAAALNKKLSIKLIDTD